MHELPMPSAERPSLTRDQRVQPLIATPASTRKGIVEKITGWRLRVCLGMWVASLVPVGRIMSLGAGWVLLMIVGGTAHTAALSADERRDHSGYLSPESPRIPAQVRTAARSVYRILVYTDTDLPFQSYDMGETEAYIDAFCSDQAGVVTEKNCQFMRACLAKSGYPATQFGWLRRQGNTEPICYLPITDGGTVFVGNRQGDYVDLVTSWHVVDARNAFVTAFLGNAIKMYPAAKRVELVKQLPLAFVLLDQHGHEVMHVSEKGATIQSIGDIVGPLATHDPAITAVGQTMEDFVTVRIKDGGKLGAPLKAYSGNVPEGEKAYAIGYPNRTTGRAHNSDGVRQFVSSGTYLSLATFLTTFQAHGAKLVPSGNFPRPGQDPPLRDLPAHGFPFPYSLPQRGHVYFDTDVIQGNSGGPTVTATGEVVGIITHSFSEADHYSPRGGFALDYHHLHGLLFPE